VAPALPSEYAPQGGEHVAARRVGCVLQPHRHGPPSALCVMVVRQLTHTRSDYSLPWWVVLPSTVDQTLCLAWIQPPIHDSARAAATLRDDVDDRGEDRLRRERERREARRMVVGLTGTRAVPVELHLVTSLSRRGPTPAVRVNRRLAWGLGRWTGGHRRSRSGMGRVCAPRPPPPTGTLEPERATHRGCSPACGWSGSGWTGTRPGAEGSAHGPAPAAWMAAAIAQSQSPRGCRVFSCNISR
jgi:hypothetical protein